MNCTDARQILGPDPGPQAASPEALAAFRHYEDCESCATFYASQRQIAARLRGIAQTQHAPPQLRARVMTAVAAEQDRFGRDRIRWDLLAAGAAGSLMTAAAALVLWFTVPSAGSVSDGMTPIVQIAARVQNDQASLVSTEPEPVRTWLAGQLSHPVTVPAIPDAQLVGARIANVDGVPVAAIDYILHGERLTYLMLPAEHVRDLILNGNDSVVALSSGAYEVMIWGEATGPRALVAAMPRQEMIVIAEHCKQESMRQL